MMLLLTVREWLGPSRNADRPRSPVVHDELRGFVTRVPLTDALRRLRALEVDYNFRHRNIAVNLSVVSVTAIEDLSDTAIVEGRLEDLDAPWLEERT